MTSTIRWATIVATPATGCVHDRVDRGGPVEIDVPRDIEATFQPTTVRKRQRRLTGGWTRSCCRFRRVG
jgi:hypothetical protein